MSKTTFLLAFSFLFQLSFSQTSSTYLVYFKDKSNSAYSINKPAEFLSEKSIERRIRQHLSIDASDLPVNTNYVNGIKSTGATVIGKSKWLNGVVVSIDDASALDLIKSLPYVKQLQLLAAPTTQKVPSKFTSYSSSSSASLEEVNSKAMNSDF